MEIPGRIKNGVVVFDGGPPLPEGLEVTVVCPQIVDVRTNATNRCVQFPLVHSDKPGSVHLTNERIAEIFDDEDAGPLSPS